MKSWVGGFNIIFLLLALGLALTGCATEASRQKKEFTTLRLYLENVVRDDIRSKTISVYRAQPAQVAIEPVPFLGEGNLVGADLVEWMGTFSIQLRFDRRGAWLLDNVTTANPGRRIAVWAEFGPTRWLAAPVISRRITDGVFTFAPDASREEAERIVRGLKNLIARAEKKDKWNVDRP